MARRHLDLEATLSKYAERVCHVPELAMLHGAWLSTFEVFSTIPRGSDGVLEKPPGMPDSSAFRLAEVCESQGIIVSGITSARRRGGEFVCPTIAGAPRETKKVVYIGAYNFFTGHERSPFTMTAADKVWLTAEKTRSSSRVHAAASSN